MSDDGRFVYVPVIYITLIIRANACYIISRIIIRSLITEPGMLANDRIAAIVDYVDRVMSAPRGIACITIEKKKGKKGENERNVNTVTSCAIW